MSERGSIFVGKNLKSLETAPDFGAYTKVILHISDESYVEAGDDSGLTLEADCPWATQATADAVLASLNGFTYKPYDGGGTQIEPAAELGDAITTNGFYGGIYREERTFGHRSSTDLAAPGFGETAHEFRHESGTERRFTRRVREVSAELGLKMDRVYTKVTDEQLGKSFGWDLTAEAMEWKANGQTVMKLNEAGLEVIGNITGGTIEIGSGFKVDSLGNMEAVSAKLSGTLNIGGQDITSAVLRAGALEGYGWGSGGGSYGGYSSRGLYALTGGGFGFNFSNMKYGELRYAQPIHASSFLYQGTQFSPRNIVVSGVTYRVLAVPT